MRSLEYQGVKTLFGYPGGSIMPTFDALYHHRDTLNHILVRHEQGAAHAAQGFARVSGEVGVCLVTSGPGATNTITGIADAMIDSTPIVVIAGQVGASFLGTDAFQEVDLVGITQPISKWSYQIRRAEDVAWAVARAFYIARSGHPGPVVLDFAKNAQVEMVDYEPMRLDFIRSYDPEPNPDKECLQEAAELINGARKPLVLVGQGVELGNAQDELRAFVEKADMPCGCTLLGLSALPTDHRLNKGMLGMHGNLGPNVKTNECDVLIAVGMRFDDRVTGKLDTYARQAKIIHLDIDSSEIDKNVKVDVPVLGNCKQTLAILTQLIGENEHTEWIDSFAEYEKTEYEQVIRKEIHPCEGALNMGEVVRAVSEASHHEAILVTDVGQNQMMAARYFKYSKNRSIVTSGGLGTMGFGLPAAIGAKIANPDKDVVCISGDGGLQMNIQELATSVVQGAGVTICVLNNYYLGMVRQMQQLFYGKRYSATCLRRRKGCPDECKGPNEACPPYTPDFIKLVESYGGHGIRVEKEEDIDAAFAEAKKYKDVPVIIEFMIATDEIVLPMVKSGNPMSEMILK